MPFSRPARRLIQGQGGSTLVELLVAMPIALLVVGLAIQSLGSASVSQQDIERRTEALTQGQIGLERMTRELRQANWVYFRTSGVVDLEARVRPSVAAEAVPRLVRYDCSASPCMRLEGEPTPYPPPSAPSFVRQGPVIGADSGDGLSRYGRVVSHDVFTPGRVNPATGALEPDFADPHFVQVRVRLKVKDRAVPIVLADGVALRNRSTFR